MHANPPKGHKSGWCLYVLYFFSMGGPETTRKIVLSRQDQKNIPETPNSSKFTEAPESAFANILGFLGVTMRGLQTPILY